MATIDPLARKLADEDVRSTHFGDAQVDGRPASWVEVEIARGAIAERVTLVAVRTEGRVWQARRRLRFPTLLVFGFSSAPEDHESVRHDFERLVARVDLRPR